MKDLFWNFIALVALLALIFSSIKRAILGDIIWSILDALGAAYTLRFLIKNNCGKEKED